MIDFEIEIFDAVYPFIKDLVPPGGFVSEYVPAPSAFPHVALMEVDNVPDRRTVDSGHYEYSAILTYEAQVYAMDKATCRSIAAALDSAMVGTIGFTKTLGQMIPNQPDPNIFRYVARYTRGVDRGGNTYRPA